MSLLSQQKQAIAPVEGQTLKKTINRSPSIGKCRSREPVRVESKPILLGRYTKLIDVMQDRISPLPEHNEPNKHTAHMQFRSNES